MDNAQEFYVYNPVNPDTALGRRTGKPLYKKKTIYNGANNFDDFLTDSDEEASINVTKNLQLSATEGKDSSQILTGVPSSGKAGATKARDLSFRKDAAAKSIQQLPPEKFDGVRFVNPLILGSRFGRRTGKDVLAGRAVTGGLEDFSAFLSDNSDISISMQATPSLCAPEQPSTYSSTKKSRDNTPVLISSDLYRAQQETPLDAFSNKQQSSQEVHEPSCPEQGTSRLHEPGRIILATEVEHVELALQDTSFNDAGNRKSQQINTGSSSVNSLQRLSFQNPSNGADVNTSKVKNSHNDKEKVCMSDSISKVKKAGPEKENLNTSKVKNSHHGHEKTCTNESMLRPAKTGSEKKNMDRAKVKNVCPEKEKACMSDFISDAKKAEPEKVNENLNKSEVENIYHVNEETCMKESLPEATQAPSEKQKLKTSDSICQDNEKGCSSESRHEATQTGPEKENVSTSKAKNNRNNDDNGLSVSKATKAGLEKKNSNLSKASNVCQETGKACMSESASKSMHTGPEKNNLNTSKVKGNRNNDERTGLSMSKATKAGSEETNLTTESEKQVGGGETNEVRTSCGDCEGRHLEKKNETEVSEPTSAEESTKNVSDVQRVVHIQLPQPAAATQVQCLDSSKDNQTLPGQNLLTRRTDVLVQERTGTAAQPESVNATQAIISRQKSSIAATSVHVPSIPEVDEQSQAENSLQTTETTGQQRASKHSTESSSALNFGGDITGSVSRSEQAAGGQFYGIKKRLSFSHALIEVEPPTLKYKQKVEAGRLAKAIPREKKSIGSFLGQYDQDNTNYLDTIAKSGTFVTLAASRISQLTSEAELLKALNRSTDSQDDFCIVEEDNVVFDSSEVAIKQQNAKPDKRQLKHTGNKNSLSATQAAGDKEKLQGDCSTGGQQEHTHLQARQERNQPDSLKKRRNRKSAKAVLDGPDTSLEAQTFISLTSQKVTDVTADRRRNVQGDHKTNKRKVKHSMKDEASPPKQIRGEEHDADRDADEQDMNCDVLRDTRVLNLQLTKTDIAKPWGKDENIDILNENNNNNSSQKAEKRKKKKVHKKLNISDKLNDAENSQLTLPEENRKEDLSSEQKNPLKIGHKGSKAAQNTSGKSTGRNQVQGLAKELQPSKDTKLPKLRSCQRSEDISDNNSSNPLQPENIGLQGSAKDSVMENNSPVPKNSRRRGRSRQTSKLGHHPGVEQTGQNSFVSQSGQHPSAIHSPRHPSITQSGQHASTNQSGQHASVIQSEQHPSAAHSPQHPSITQSGQHPSTNQSGQRASNRQPEQSEKPTNVSKKATVGNKLKQKQKGSKKHKAGRGRKNQTSGKSAKVTSVRGRRMLTRLATYFNINAIYESIAEEGSNISNTDFNNTAHSVVEMNVSKYNPVVGENALANVSKKGYQKVKRVSTVTVETNYTENCTDKQETGDGNHIGSSSEKSSDEGKCVGVSVPMERLESNKRRASRKSVAGKVRRSLQISPRDKSVDGKVRRSLQKSPRDKSVVGKERMSVQTSPRDKSVDGKVLRSLQTSPRNKSVAGKVEGSLQTSPRDKSVAGKVRRSSQTSSRDKCVAVKGQRSVQTTPRDKSVHCENTVEDGSPPKLQLMSSLPNVTPRSGISFRRSRSRCQSSYPSDVGSCSPPSVPRIPARNEECFTPHLKEQKTPPISSCLKTAGSSVKPRRKGRRVRISSIIDQRMCSPVETDTSDSQSGATTSLRSVNSSPVHYGETTTDNVDSISRRASIVLPDLSYKIIRPEPSHMQGLRRSARTRVMRLNSHKGEEIIYRRDSAGFGLVVDSIQPSVGEARVKALEERRRKKLKQRKLKAMKVPAKPPKRLSTHWKVDDVITSSSEVPVINPDTNEPVVLELIARGDSASWYGPNLDPVTGTEPVALCLHLKQQMFTTGEMNMRPLAEKPSEHTEHTLILYVICGKVLLRINNVSTIVDSGDSFFIPRGTSYSIKNLRREIAKLYFIDINDTDKEHSFAKSFSAAPTSDQAGNRSDQRGNRSDQRGNRSDQTGNR